MIPRLAAAAFVSLLSLGSTPLAAQPSASGAPAADAPVNAAALARARALTERREYPGALELYRQLRERSPRNDDLAIEVARVLGYADRNADAAALYREVIGFAPTRRRDVLESLAWQTLWADDPAGAEPLFVELTGNDWPAAVRGPAWRGLAEARQALGRLDAALAAYEGALALAPDDRALARRRAQTLLWMDRHDEAIAAFEALIAKDPADRLSGHGLAQARNYAGRHRAALSTWRGIGEARDNDERLERARALQWAGFEDLAHQALDGVPLADAQWLRAWRTGRELRPSTWGAWDRITDRDRLEVKAWQLGATWRAGGGRSVDVGWRRADLSDPNGAARGDRLWLTVTDRWGGPESARGTFWPSVTLAANHWPGWSPVTGAARVRWVPADGWRFDAELGREVIETPLAISRQVSVVVGALGAEWRPNPRWSVAGQLASLRFDDGNQRWRATARVDYALRFRPKVVVGLEGQTFTSSDPTGPSVIARGYWNPRRYQEARAYIGLYHDAHPWEFQARLGAGTSRELDGFGNRASGSPNLWELVIARDFSPAWRGRLVAGGSGSGLGSASGGTGYWRRYVGASLTGWW